MQLPEPSLLVRTRCRDGCIQRIAVGTQDEEVDEPKPNLPRVDELCANVWLRDLRKLIACWTLEIAEFHDLERGTGASDHVSLRGHGRKVRIDRDRRALLALSAEVRQRADARDRYHRDQDVKTPFRPWLGRLHHSGGFSLSGCPSLLRHVSSVSFFASCTIPRPSAAPGGSYVAPTPYRHTSLFPSPTIPLPP